MNKWEQSSRVNKDFQDEMASAVAANNLDAIDRLLARGCPANLEFENSDDATPLHKAAFLGHFDTVRLLLDRGCPVNVYDMSRNRETPLHCAAKSNSVQVAQLLMERGCSVYESGDLTTPLHAATKEGHIEVARLLLDGGCPADVRDWFKGRTPLHYAVFAGHIEVARLLLDRGCSVEIQDKFNRTPLPYAAQEGHIEVARLLLDRGCPADARDKYNGTPLHSAAQSGHVEVARLLLDRGCPVDVQDCYNSTPLRFAAFIGHIEVARLLLDRDCPVDVQDCYDCTPLHDAAQKGHVELARLLLDRGSAVDIQDVDGESPMAKSVRFHFRDYSLRIHHQSNSEQRRDRDQLLSMLQLLVTRGASCELARSFLLEEKTPEAGLVVAVVDGWEEQRTRGAALSTIQAELLDGDVDDVRFFFQSLKCAGSNYRAKLCVVGPSSWGKTSLIKSLTRNEPSLEDEDKRTIGIDLFSWSFITPPAEPGTSHHYDVSVWDFAGQEEYRSAHSLFYSKRTLYVICVNMEAYVESLTTNAIEPRAEKQTAVDTFFDENIYSCVRSICAHEPESEFVFVGTKLDRVKEDTEEWLQRVSEDLFGRVNSRLVEESDQLDRMIYECKFSDRDRASGSSAVAVDGQTTLQRLESLRRLRPRFLCDKLIAMSSATLTGLSNLKNELQRWILSSDSSYSMPTNYALVGLCIENMVQEAKKTASGTARIAQIFVPVKELTGKLIETTPSVTLDSEARAILRMLHGIGDILWFEDAKGDLSDIVFLSPALVIDFIRNVVNHELGVRSLSGDLNEYQRALRDEGRVTHAFLQTLELWRDVKDETVMMQLKKLLLNFQLAYPAGSGVLQWNSDLIVPVYWKKATAPQPQAPTRSERPESLLETISWEYEFRTGLPESVFDRFGVKSYSAHYSCDRHFTGTSFETKRPDEYRAQVSKQRGGDGVRTYPSLRILVHAASIEVAWEQLLWYVISLERLLEEYPGLWVVRYAVSRDGKRYELDRLITERHEGKVASGVTGFNASTRSSASELLPPKMEWYENKIWNAPEKQVSESTRDSGSEQTAAEKLVGGLVIEIHRLRNEVRDAQNTIQQTVITAVSEHSKYPALWTITYRDKSIRSQYEVKLRSQLSGKCFHSPIVITVPSDVFSKYGVVIKTGLSVLSAVVPDMFGKGVVDMLMAAGRDQIDRAMQVHSLVDNLHFRRDEAVEMGTNQMLSPDGTVNLLHELLEIANGGKLHPREMSNISGLECGFWSKYGTHLWAHHDELLAMGDEIILRNPGAASPAVAPSVKHPETASARAADVFPTGLPSSKVNILRTPTPSGMAELDAATGLMDAHGSEVYLEVQGAHGLPSVRRIGVQSPYCKWKFTDPDGGVLASGRTPTHNRGGRSPDWSGHASVIQTGSTAKSLAGCRFWAVVKTATIISFISEVIAEGTLRFDAETVSPSAGKRSEFELELMARGEPAGLLKFRLRF